MSCKIFETSFLSELWFFDLENPIITSYGPKTIDIHAKILGKNEVFHGGKWFNNEKIKAKRDTAGDEYSNRLFVPGASERARESVTVLGKELCEKSGGVKIFKDGVRTQKGSEIL